MLLLAKRALLLPILVLVISCSRAVERPGSALPSPSASPTATQAFPTLQPTRTLTPHPTVDVTPGIDLALGETLFRDPFEEDRGWSLEGIAAGGLSLIEGRLALSVTTRSGALYAVAPTEIPSNFYVEVEIKNEICAEKDEFGIAFRFRSPSEHYRFVLTCNGKARFTRVLNGRDSALIPLTDTFAALSGVPAQNRLAVLAEGSEYRFFINDLEVFSARDSSLPSGQIAVMVWVRDGQQATASFDEFMLQALVVP